MLWSYKRHANGMHKQVIGQKRQKRGLMCGKPRGLMGTHENVWKRTLTESTCRAFDNLPSSGFFQNSSVCENTWERVGTFRNPRFGLASKSGARVNLAQNRNAWERLGTDCERGVILPAFQFRCEKTDISAQIQFETRVSFANPWEPYGTLGNYHPT